MTGQAKNSRFRRWEIILGRWAAVFVVLFFVLHLTGFMERLFYHPIVEPTPPPETFPGAESVWFESADGTRLHGWFIPAQGEERSEVAGENYPTIIHVHGNAGNINSHIGFTDWAPVNNLNLFIFDYRGYGQSQGSATTRGPLIEDTHAALDAVLELPNVDPDRIGLYAQSLGGSIGLNVMAGRDEFRCGVIVSAFTSWKDIAASVIGSDPPGVISSAIAGVLIEDSHRPTDAIAEIDRPLLILHGKKDRIVPISHSRRLVKAAGENAELIEVEDGDHNTMPWSSPEALEYLIAFLHKHLEK